MNCFGYLLRMIKWNVFCLTSTYIYVYYILFFIFQLQPSPSSCCWQAWTVLPIHVSTCFSRWSSPNCWELSCAWNKQTWSRCLRRLQWSALCIWALKATLTYGENETTLTNMSECHERVPQYSLKYEGVHVNSTYGSVLLYISQYHLIHHCTGAITVLLCK